VSFKNAQIIPSKGIAFIFFLVITNSFPLQGDGGKFFPLITNPDYNRYGKEPYNPNRSQIQKEVHHDSAGRVVRRKDGDYRECNQVQNA